MYAGNITPITAAAAGSLTEPAAAGGAAGEGVIYSIPAGTSLPVAV